MDAFIRDGYVVVRGAFDAGTAAACRAVIWDSMSGQGIREDDPATWPPLVFGGQSWLCVQVLKHWLGFHVSL